MVDVIAPGASKYAKNAMDAILKPTIKQNLEFISGERENFSLNDILDDATIRFTTSSVLKMPVKLFPTPGLNKIFGGLICSIGRGFIKYFRTSQ